jgi:hypothetical protein
MVPHTQIVVVDEVHVDRTFNKGYESEIGSYRGEINVYCEYASI